MNATAPLPEVRRLHDIPGEAPVCRQPGRADARVVASLVILAIVAILALSAPLLPLDPFKMDLNRMVERPSSAHVLGTDSFGRDIAARLVHGGRVSLRVGIVAVLMAVSIGTTAGLIAGYWRGLTDSVIMRLADALLAFPAILLAVALIGILGPDETSVMIALGVVYTPVFARVARSKAISLRETEYVLAAQALGASSIRIILRHIVPNAMGPVLVQMTVALAYAVIAEAGMSFLGLGTQPPQPSWGLMLAEARPYIQTSPWYPLLPGLALAVVVLNITVLGDWLRERLDPKAS